MIDALRRASANRITAVIRITATPKQDKDERPRTDLGQAAGQHAADGGRRAISNARPCTPAEQGFFDVPVDNSDGPRRTCESPGAIEKLFGEKCVVVSPDAGGVPRRVLRQTPEVDAGRYSSSAAGTRRLGSNAHRRDVEGKIAVVVDDMISTGGTLVKASEALIKRGATEVYCLATHGIFAGDAISSSSNRRSAK